MYFPTIFERYYPMLRYNREIIKSAYSHMSSISRISLWGKENCAVQNEDVPGQSLFTKVCRTERMKLPFICILILQCGKRSDVITRTKPREAVREIRRSVWLWYNQELTILRIMAILDGWRPILYGNEEKALLLRESFSKTRSFSSWFLATQKSALCFIQHLLNVPF